MAVGGEDGLFQIDVINEVLYFGAVLVRETVARGVGDVDYGCPRVHHRLYHPRKVFVVGAAGVLGVELHVVHKTAGKFHRFHCTFDDLFAVGVELVFDVHVRCADTGMDPFAFGVFQ